MKMIAENFVVLFLRDVWERRELLIHFVAKTLKIQYRRPLLGFAWAFIIPFVMVCVFMLIFSLFLRIPVEPYPFFIYFMTAFFPWQYFANSIVRGTPELMENKRVIKQAAFPFEIIPLSIVFVSLIHFLPMLGIVLFFLWVFKMSLPVWLCALPFVMFAHTLLIVGITLMTSSLYIRFRDLRYGLDILIFVLFYLTPAFYPLTVVETQFSPLLLKVYLLNPLVGILHLYRLCLLDGFLEVLPAASSLIDLVVVPVAAAFLFFVVGVYVFKKEKQFIIDNILV